MHDSRLNGKGRTILTDSRTRPDDVFRRTEVFRETHEDEYVLSLGDSLRVVWRRLWVIMLVAALLVGAAAGFSLLRTLNYEASIKILIGQEQSDASDNLSSEVQGLQKSTKTMAEAVDTRPVAQEVIQRLNLAVSPEAFLEDLNVAPIADTQFIEVSYQDPSPERAQQVANTVGDVFSEQVSEVSPSANAVAATVWERAVVPSSPKIFDLVRNVLLALVLGLILGVWLAFLLEHLDDKWRSPEEVEQVSGVPTFGIIPTFKVRKSKKKEGN